jgi:hypothetical protein
LNSTLAVVVNKLPVPAISGESKICKGAGETTYSTEVGMKDYAWTISGGGEITSGNGTNSIKVKWNNSGYQQVNVNYTNAAGCSAKQATSFNVTVNDLPATAGTITGPDQVCQGTQGVLFSIPIIENATSYQWSLPVGAEIVSGAGNNLIVVNFTEKASSGNIKVNGTNSCGSGLSSPLFNLTLKPVPAAAVISNKGDTLYSNAPSGNQWYFNNVPIKGATGSSHIAAHAGFYYVVVTKDLCSSMPSNLIVLTTVVSASDLQNNLSFEVYPNPNSGKFNIRFVKSETTKFDIEIFNNTGVLITRRQNEIVNGVYENNIDLESIAPGVYLVKIGNKDFSLMRKIIVR